jgi:hypothetical protein
MPGGPEDAMRTQHARSAILLPLIVFSLTLITGRALSGNEDWTLDFPEPPNPEAIGTQVGSVNTWIRRVTVSPPASVHRAGLSYSEIRGTIEGVGWGGQPTTLRCHYSYALPFVLRIPPAWSGGLVTFRHGSAPLALWEDLEAAIGSRSIGRIFHETADRMVSDVALHPSRRWAFFAVNYVGVAPGGVHNTLLVGGEPGCTGGAATQGIADVTITRDHALLARHLLKTLRGREPSMVLGTGHSAGVTAHMLINAGVDHRRAGVVQVGDNHLTPYDCVGPDLRRLPVPPGRRRSTASLGVHGRHQRADDLRQHRRGPSRHVRHGQRDQRDGAQSRARRSESGPAVHREQHAPHRLGFRPQRRAPGQ